MSDNYVGVTAHLRARTARAVKLENENGGGWVPRSCIHGGDERALDVVAIDDEITLRMFEWVAIDRRLM